MKGCHEENSESRGNAAEHASHQHKGVEAKSEGINTNFFVIALVSFLLLLSVVQAVALNDLQSKIGSVSASVASAQYAQGGASSGSPANGVATGSASGKLNTVGWTENEVMNYEMHGTVPARIQQGAAPAASSAGAPAQVGGC